MGAMSGGLQMGAMSGVWRMGAMSRCCVRLVAYRMIKRGVTDFGVIGYRMAACRFARVSLWLVTLAWFGGESPCAQAQATESAYLGGRNFLDPEIPGPLSMGESTGFGSAMVWIGDHLMIGAPRSHSIVQRGGALWGLHLPGRDADRAVRNPGVYALPLEPGLPWQNLGHVLAFDERLACLAVGAPLAPSLGQDAGRVYLYDVHDSGQHVPEPVLSQSLELPGAGQSAGFGFAVQIAGDQLWASAPFAQGESKSEDAGGGDFEFGRGMVAGFASGGMGMPWELLGPGLRCPDRGAHPYFGYALQASPGGLVVGAPGLDDLGAVYVMNSGSTNGPSIVGNSNGAQSKVVEGSAVDSAAWTCEQVLRPNGPRPVSPEKIPAKAPARGAGISGLAFGSALALSGDGRKLFVGVPGAGRGEVWVYAREEFGRHMHPRGRGLRTCAHPACAFHLQRILRPGDARVLGGFGQALCLTDGVLWVGAPGGPGAVVAIPGVECAGRAEPLPQATCLGEGSGSAFGDGLLPWAKGCLVGQPGRGVIAGQAAPVARLRALRKPRFGSQKSGPGPGYRWVLIWEPAGAFRAQLWGLFPGESGTWSLARPAGGPEVASGTYLADDMGHSTPLFAPLRGARLPGGLQSQVVLEWTVLRPDKAPQTMVVNLE